MTAPHLQALRSGDASQTLALLNPQRPRHRPHHHHAVRAPRDAGVLHWRQWVGAHTFCGICWVVSVTKTAQVEVDVCMMDKRTSAQCTSGPVDQCTRGRVDQRISGRVDTWTSGRADKRTSDSPCQQVDDRVVAPADAHALTRRDFALAPHRRALVHVLDHHQPRRVAPQVETESKF